MNFRNTLLALCALLLPAATTRAALTLNVESIVLMPGESGFIEVFFTELPPAANENLVAYAVGLDIGNPSGVSFGPAPLLREPTAHPFVFAPGTPIDDTGSNASRIRSSAAILTAPENIADNEGVLRVPVTVAPDAPLGPRPVVFALTGGLTEFSDDIGGVIEFVPVNGVIRVGDIPEPAGTCLVTLPGLATLCSRRRRLAVSRAQ